MSTLPPPDPADAPRLPAVEDPSHALVVEPAAAAAPPATGAPAAVPLSAGSVATMAPVRARQRQILWMVLAVIVVAGLLRLFGHHENHYEHLARELTVAVQSNSLPAVQKLENVETAADMSRAALGHAADQLAPLGEIKHVRETTSSADAARVHEFDVTFDKGVAHEKIQFDPDDKVYHFRYDLVPPK